MDLTHLHLLLNHFPIIGTIIGIGIMLWGLIKKEYNIQKTVLGLWVILTLLTFPVMKTGEEAEETIENIPGISEQIMHEHEEAAEFALWMMVGLGLLSLAALLMGQKNNLGKKLPVVAFIFSLAVFGAMARTGYLGGQIRHTELQGTNIATTTGEGSGNTNTGKAPTSESGEDD
jgi:uncharacterized membrane protein